MPCDSVLLQCELVLTSDFTLWQCLMKVTSWSTSGLQGNPQAIRSSVWYHSSDILGMQTKTQECSH